MVNKLEKALNLAFQKKPLQMILVYSVKPYYVIALTPEHQTIPARVGGLLASMGILTIHASKAQCPGPTLRRW